MSTVVITGAAGLVGSETAAFLCDRGLDVVGIDNDMRSTFFGPEASTEPRKRQLLEKFPSRYRHEDIDVRDQSGIDSLFRSLGTSISLVVHTAAQPSHDWAASDPITDFTVNANGTLNVLEATRRHAPEAVFIFTSTNKVYGDLPNSLPLVELATRWEIESGHRFENGIDESMSIDGSLHSLFGASKVAGDVLVQEYGRYFGLRTAAFRGGCLTGPHHAGAVQHGFLAYLMKCVVQDVPYTVYGYKGKQVRDNIHSADLVAAFWEFYRAPSRGEVYNMGGGRFSNCSMLEAISLCQEIAGRQLRWSYSESSRVGDHIWYISDTQKFQTHYPGWQPQFDLRRILEDIYAENAARWMDETTRSRSAS
jgi:CDP-paratose 2-epimerase